MNPRLTSGFSVLLHQLKKSLKEIKVEKIDSLKQEVYNWYKPVICNENIYSCLFYNFWLLVN